MLDLILGRNYFMSSHLAVQPIIGVKSNWLVQRAKLYSTDFIDASQAFAPIVGRINATTKNSCSFWGVGPQAGAEVSWYLSQNFRLLTHATGALIYSYFKTQEKERIIFEPVGSTRTSTRIKMASKFHRFIPYMRMLMGLSWGTSLNQKKAVSRSQYSL